MTREQYDQLSAPLVRTLLDMEDDILREIAAQLSRDGDISDTSKWRIRQLARAGRFDKRAAAIIAGYSEVEDGQAMDAVLTAAETEIGYLDNAVQAANAAGLSEYFSDIPAEESALGAAKAFQKQAASDLNLVNTVMQYKAGSAYVNAVNAIYRDTAEGRQGALDIMGKGAAKAVSGQMSLQEATRKTIRELAQKGIPAFVDKRGREWSPEAYVMMDMRSTLGNTARAAQNARCDEYNIQLIEVSSHMGSRPLCAPYQGRIFSRDGSKGVTTDGAGGKIYYTPLSETSYGQPAGLFGINCGHVQYPFVPGINFQRYFPYPKEENDRRYMQFQQQRAMERGIRAAKRECMMLQETGDTEGLQKASLRLRNQREKYRAYCKETGLKQHNDRTQVYGYDRSKSAKTVWAERKAQSGNGGAAPVLGTSSGGNSQNNPNSGLKSGGGSGIIKSSNIAPAKSLSLSNLNEFDEWQKKYYAYNSGVSFARNDNQNIYTYTGGAYDAINALERGGEQLERARRCYGEAELSKYEGIGNKISEELSKFKLHEPINVRRVVGNVDYITGATSSIEDMKNSIGKLFTEKGFTSTTVLSDSALPFASGKKTESTRATLDIYVPPNSRGAYIYKISEHPAEFEYLLDRNTKYKVIDAGEREVVDKYTGKTTIERFMKLEVIPDD